MGFITNSIAGSGSTSNSGGTTIVLGNGQGGNSGTDWTDWARLALGAYQALKKPSFSQQPMSDEQKKIYQIYLDNLMNPTYKNLGPDVVARAQQQADRLGQGGWTSPKTFSGDVGYSGSGGLPSGASGASPWGSSPNARIPPPIPAAVNQIGSTPDLARKFTPNMRTWEPASGFPLSPTMAETDPNREVSLDRANHPLANANPSGANGSLFQTGRDIGANWATGQPGQGFDTNGAPSGMTRSAGDLPGFISFLQSNGVKDASKVALGLFSGGLVGAALATAKVWWDHYQSSKPKGGG